MPSIFDNKQGTSFAPGSLAAAPAGGVGGMASPPISQHPSATSTGSGPFGFGPYIPPDQMGAWFNKMQEALGGKTYSLQGGGYIPTDQANNANSFYNKFGGSDPASNKQVADFYNSLGELPTSNNLTPAAQQLAAETPGYQPQLGPSVNDRLGAPWQGPWMVDPNRKQEHVGFTGPGGN